jgi:hypothetical protein
MASKRPSAKKSAPTKKAAPRRKAAAEAPPPPPPPSGMGEVIDNMGPRLRAEFAQLQKSERRLLRALNNPETAQAFAADPLGTLTGLRIDVPPIIKSRLKAAPITGDAPNLQQARAFRLPNGQVVTARVNLRFTGTPRGD